MQRSASLSSNQLYNLDYLEFEFYHIPVNVWFALHVYIHVPQAWIVLTLSRHVNGTHSLLLGQEKQLTAHSVFCMVESLHSISVYMRAVCYDILQCYLY